MYHYILNAFAHAAHIAIEPTRSQSKSSILHSYSFIDSNKLLPDLMPLVTKTDTAIARQEKLATEISL